MQNNNHLLKHKTHNQLYVRIDGTHLQGEIKCSYTMIKKAFGKPSEGDGYKTDAEWDILFDDGLVATIYNYKNGRNYLGKKGTPKTRIENWHVGGRDQGIIARVWYIITQDNYYGD